MIDYSDGKVKLNTLYLDAVLKYKEAALIDESIYWDKLNDYAKGLSSENINIINTHGNFIHKGNVEEIESTSLLELYTKIQHNFYPSESLIYVANHILKRLKNSKNALIQVNLKDIILIDLILKENSKTNITFYITEYVSSNNSFLIEEDENLLEDTFEYIFNNEKYYKLNNKRKLKYIETLENANTYDYVIIQSMDYDFNKLLGQEAILDLVESEKLITKLDIYEGLIPVELNIYNGSSYNKYSKILSFDRNEERENVVVYNHIISGYDDYYDTTEELSVGKFQKLEKIWGLDVFNNEKEIKKYLQTKGKKIKLGEGASVIRGKSILSATITGVGNRYNVLNIKDIDETTHNFKSDTYITLKPNKAKKYLIKQHDILISTRGSNVRLAYVDNNPTNVIISCNLSIIRTNYKLSSEYLFTFLQSNLGIQIIEAIGRDKGIFNLRPTEIENIEIPYFHKNSQTRIGREFMGKRHDYNNALEQLNQNYISDKADIFNKITKKTKSFLDDIKLEFTDFEFYSEREQQRLPKDLRKPTNFDDYLPQRALGKEEYITYSSIYEDGTLSYGDILVHNKLIINDSIEVNLYYLEFIEEKTINCHFSFSDIPDLSLEEDLNIRSSYEDYKNESEEDIKKDFEYFDYESLEIYTYKQRIDVVDALAENEIRANEFFKINYDLIKAKYPSEYNFSEQYKHSKKIYRFNDFVDKNAKNS